MCWYRFRAGAAVTLLSDLLSDRERGDRVLRHLRRDRQRGRHGGGACRIPPCPGVEPREPAGGSLLWVHRLDAHTACHGVCSMTTSTTPNSLCVRAYVTFSLTYFCHLWQLVILQIGS